MQAEQEVGTEMLGLGWGVVSLAWLEWHQGNPRLPVDWTEKMNDNHVTNRWRKKVRVPGFPIGDTPFICFDVVNSVLPRH